MAAKCYDCGLKYDDVGWIEAIIPDKVWNFISPTGDEGGILCVTCISRRLAEKGLRRIPVWFCGIEPLKAQWGDPSVMVQRTWEPKLIKKIIREKGKMRHIDNEKQ